MSVIEDTSEVKYSLRVFRMLTHKRHWRAAVGCESLHRTPLPQPVVIDHGAVIRALPASRLADAFRLGVGAEVDVGEVHPDEDRFA
jgi:hypothetical protein